MLQESNMSKVAGIFFNEPTKIHYLMDISRKIILAHTSVKKYLDILQKEKIIVKSEEKRGSRKFPLYRADLDSNNYKKEKKAFNYFELLNSGLINFLDDKFLPKSMVLFGSYQKGEDIEDSDIDIYLECNREEIDLSKFEMKLFRKIELHFGNPFNKYPKELKNNIANGIVLEGYLKCYENNNNSRSRKSKLSKD